MNSEHSFDVGVLAQASRVATQRLWLPSAVIGLTFILRVFYANYLYEDDGLWFTAAEEILRGKALYREIYFDKPPGLPLLYALLFKCFGAHILVIRLFTIGYAAGVSALLYAFGSRLYDRRAGAWAAVTFAIFSTTHSTGHMQGLNTDFLMVLPYTAGAYLFIASRGEAGMRRALVALAAGASLGLAFQINSKSAFGLLFVVGLIAGARLSSGSAFKLKSEAVLVGLVGAGFAAGSLPFLVYIAWSSALADYWLFVWDWGWRYGSYRTFGQSLSAGVLLSASYFALNNTILVASAFVVGRAIRPVLARVRHRKGDLAARVSELHKSDLTLLLWLAVSYAATAAGGRFYAHYFFQSLPALCLLSAGGLLGIGEALRGRRMVVKRAAFAVLAVGFAFTLVRFHGRTVMLAAGWLRGGAIDMSGGWYTAGLNREERMVAAEIRDLPDGAQAAAVLPLEAIRAGGPRTRPAQGAADYLFVWGYRPELYYWSGLLPASRYLSTQPLTGVPADVHYINGERRSIIDGALTEAARAKLLRDLETIRPKYIIDELGFFNAELAIDDFPELRELLKDYKNLGATGRFFIYRRRDMARKRMMRGQ